MYKLAKALSVSMETLLESATDEQSTESSIERSYEYGLPDYLQKDLDAYKDALENGSTLLDCLWGELYASINIAEINDGFITPAHADYLRQKFLWGIIPALGEIKLDKLTQNDLQNFYTHLKTTGRLQYTEQQGNGLSDRMVRGCHASCRMALEKAVKEGLITMNPAIGCKLPPKKAREMQILTHDEMQRFLIQAKHDGYYEIFLLDLSTGLRRGELMGLQWKDLNFTTGELRVERQVSRVNGELKTFPPKTKSSIRTVVLPPSVLKMLKAYQPSINGSKWIFPSPVKTDDSPRDPHTVYSKMQLVLERAECKRIRFHDLRHTFATMALEHGMDVKTLSAMIGHVSSATTLDIYSHITTEMQISAAQKIDKGIGKVDTTIREDAVPTPKKRERTMTDFKPKQGKIRKSGTGGIYQISENLWEGRFTPTNAQGKREAHNVYAKTKEECERLLDEMIVEVRQQIQAEKEQMKGMSL